MINAARGPVVDNAALSALLAERDDLVVFLDTWEHEPQISPTLLRQVDLATPHIAGYSVEGRLRGTQMVLDAACRHFGVEATWNMASEIPHPQRLDLADSDDDLAFWRQLFATHCNIRRDHEALMAGAELDASARGSLFESLRRVYPDRLEYPRWRIDPARAGKHAQTLARLGFTPEN